MKKIIPIFALVLAFLFGENAMAAERNLIYNSDFSVSGNVTFPSNIFDNSLTTNTASIGSRSQFSVDFKNPIKLTKLKYLSAELGISIYDSNGVKVLDSVLQNNYASGVLSLRNLPFDNVSKIVFMNKDSNAKSIVEIELYGEGEIFNSGVSNLTSSNISDVEATLNWALPVSDQIESVEVFINDELLSTLASSSTSIRVTDLFPKTSYKFDLFVLYKDGSKSVKNSINVTTLDVPKDVVPPSNITNLLSTVKFDSVTFDYSLPTDLDFSHIRIFRDNNLIQADFKEAKFIDTDVLPNTTYIYQFVSVDSSGNVSNGYISTVTTPFEEDEIPPSIPLNVTATNGNGSSTVSWDKNTSDKDFAGYNLYVNGKKVNQSLIKGNSYLLSNLENSKSYQIYVTAVDHTGNESESSNKVTVKPTIDGMPVIGVDTDLKDVSDGAGSWFKTLWPLLAFSVGIVLAFIIAHRVRTLIIS